MLHCRMVQIYAMIEGGSCVKCMGGGNTGWCVVLARWGSDWGQAISRLQSMSDRKSASIPPT